MVLYSSGSRPEGAEPTKSPATNSPHTVPRGRSKVVEMRKLSEKESSPAEGAEEVAVTAGLAAMAAAPAASLPVPSSKPAEPSSGHPPPPVVPDVLREESAEDEAVNKKGPPPPPPGAPEAGAS